MSAHRTLSRTRVATAVSALGLATVLAACGGGSSSTAATSSMPATASVPATPADTAMASPTDTATGAGMGGATGGMGSMTYPPVTPGPAAAGAHNAADIAFAEGMIPHHGQAVQMADMVFAKTSTADVKTLAEQIKAAQGPEIATMSGWLKGWGTTAPDPYATMGDGMTGMGSGGMMSSTQMHQLDTATGMAADKVFLTLMPEHHQGAIAMAKTELAKGVNAQAKKLAQSIITGQTAEITRMKTMLTTLG